MSDALDAAVAELRALENPTRRAGNERVGISPTNALGVAMPLLRGIARRHPRDHALALALWDTGIHEARILAGLVDDPAQVTDPQMERWVRDFDSWDVCDEVCELFERTPFAWSKAVEWAGRPEEYVRRAGFTLMACLAARGKGEPDERFLGLLPVIRAGATDERNYVRKAASWALRNIGKRNARLREAAMACAEEIRADGSRPGRWIASDVLRELKNPAPSIRARLERGP